MSSDGINPVLEIADKGHARISCGNLSQPIVALHGRANGHRWIRFTIPGGGDVVIGSDDQAEAMLSLLKQYQKGEDFSALIPKIMWPTKPGYWWKVRFVGGAGDTSREIVNAIFVEPSIPERGICIERCGNPERYLVGSWANIWFEPLEAN